MESLAERQCIPCRGDVPPLTREQLAPLVAHIDAAWEVRDVPDVRRGSVTMLKRDYRFRPPNAGILRYSGNLCLHVTAWWGWKDSNFQPNGYQLLACEVPEVSGFMCTSALSPQVLRWQPRFNQTKAAVE